MRKILVSDYDGTFYINDEDIERNIRRVKKFQEKNHVFIIATGRSYHDFKEVLQEHKIPYDYLIINQGATILDSKDHVIANYPIEDSVKEQLIKELNLYDQDNMFVCKKLESRVSIKENQVTKIHKRFDSFEETREVSQRINERYKNEINSYVITPTNATEIISAKTNKAKAIQVVIDRENIEKGNVHTIGDSYNDMEMLTAFHGACMKNAAEEVKQICRRTYSSVSELIDELLGEENEETKSTNEYNYCD